MKKIIKVCVAFYIIIMLSSQYTFAQPQFNHTTLYVLDLDKSAEFYTNVMQLERIPEPFHDNRHVWFKIGPHCQLHVVQGAAAIISHDINIHIAFSVPSLDKFTAHLKEKHVKFGNWAGNSETPQKRPDGVDQVYLQDPDGYWIEINNDRF